MSHRAFAGLIVALGASSVLSLAGAQPGTAQVSLLSVVPGTPSGDGDWCVGTARVMLTASAVDVASQSELTEGTIVWEVCESLSRGGFPKEVCDTGGGSARWRGAVLSHLSFDSSPSIGTSPRVPVLGFRLQYRPASGSALKGARSASFNLDTTCSP
jgi:hypothetical protein